MAYTKKKVIRPKIKKTATKPDVHIKNKINIKKKVNIKDIHLNSVHKANHNKVDYPKINHHKSNQNKNNQNKNNYSKKSFITKPVLTKPIITKLISKPVLTKSVITKSVISKPIISKPAIDKSVVLKNDVSKKVAAIFDIDKTIVAGNTGSIYVMHLFMEGMIGPFDALKINWQIFKYLLNSVDYEKGMKEAYSVTKGWSVEKVRRIIHNMYQKKIKYLIYEDMKDIIEKHIEKGRIIIFISNSWDMMVLDIVDELKPNYWFATNVEIKDGMFTGFLKKPCYGKYKADYLLNLAKEQNIDLKDSYAYSDHISDLPMLEAVGNPIAVNPDKKLKKVAQDRGWKIFYPK
jgi:HAD superfamily hydrolase (TIGR01490 family)